MGDCKSGGYWWVTLPLLCLQLFVAGLWIICGLAYWWVRAAALAFYSFGTSTIYAGSWGLCFLVTSSLCTSLSTTFLWSLIVAMCLINYWCLLVFKFIKPTPCHQVAPHPHPYCVVAEHTPSGHFKYKASGSGWCFVGPVGPFGFATSNIVRVTRHTEATKTYQDRHL